MWKVVPAHARQYLLQQRTADYGQTSISSSQLNGSNFFHSCLLVLHYLYDRASFVRFALRSNPSYTVGTFQGHPGYELMNRPAHPESLRSSTLSSAQSNARKPNIQRGSGPISRASSSALNAAARNQLTTESRASHSPVTLRSSKLVWRLA